MKRLAILALLALVSPVRRGSMAVEGLLVRAEYRLRQGTGALFITLALTALVGCGGAGRHARTALDVTAHAIVATDALVAPIYDEHADAARTAALDAHRGLDEDDVVRADYRARMARLDAVLDALQASRSALLAAQSGLDARGSSGVLPVLGCVAIALEHLVDTLVAAGLDPPTQLTKAVTAAASLTGTACATEAVGASAIAGEVTQ